MAGKNSSTRLCRECGNEIVIDIVVRSVTLKKLYKDEVWLRDKYENEKLSMQKIGSICGVTSITIRDWLIRHGIDTRSPGEK